MKISGKQFKKALQLAEITQEKAAELIGVSRQTVNTWVKSAELSKASIDKINQALQIDFTSGIEATAQRNRNVTHDNDKPLGNNTELPSMGYNRVKAEGINQQLSYPLLYARFEEIVDRQQEQIIQLLTTTRLLKDELKLLKSV